MRTEITTSKHFPASLCLVSISVAHLKRDFWWIWVMKFPFWMTKNCGDTRLLFSQLHSLMLQRKIKVLLNATFPGKVNVMWLYMPSFKYLKRAGSIFEVPNIVDYVVKSIFVSCIFFNFASFFIWEWISEIVIVSMEL